MTPAIKRPAKDPELFINRELSWLEFNARVLEEARDTSNRLLDRLRFATIVVSNLDEFFMVRVAGLRHRMLEGDMQQDSSGLTPQVLLSRIAERTRAMVEETYSAVQGEILPALTQHGLRVDRVSGLDPGAAARLEILFHDDILPALTPLAIDVARPFPVLANLSLNLAVHIQAGEADAPPKLAVVQVPAMLPRLVPVVTQDGESHVLIEELIRTRLEALFPGQRVISAALFRVTRDAELELDDEGGRDYLENIELELQRRRRNDIVRLELETGANQALAADLIQRAGLQGAEVYEVSGPLDLRVYSAFVERVGYEALRDPVPRPQRIPALLAGQTFTGLLDAQDIVLHHPYESFDAIVDLLEEAAADPDVLAIKQTLYRTSGDSPVVEALVRAAENGKQVTVLVEVLARFDEESNIRWAQALERAGAHVLYGVRGYKTHAKILLIVKRSRLGIRRYIHLGTGNYNDRTARIYTDVGLMTSDPVIGADASAFFNALTGYSDTPRMKKLVMAPTRLRERFLRLIARERGRAEQGQTAMIQAKMNSLVDEEIIRALYEAARAGVRIRLNVRGVCCLRPGIKGTSESIEVTSVVDRLLEHSRIFHFQNGGEDEVYLSSADWMPRNLDWRVELLVPVESGPGKAKLLAVLDVMFSDTVKARTLRADGTYVRRKPGRGKDPVRAQTELFKETAAAAARLATGGGVVLVPIRPPKPK